MAIGESGERDSRPNALGWVMWIATAAMLIGGVVLAARKFRSSPEQDELLRYAELTVPAYLEEVAQVDARLDRLGAHPGPSATEARALLVEEVMPLLIRTRQHATSVNAESAPVVASNAEFLAGVDRLMEVQRAAVRALDDPAISGEEGHRMMRERRREADDLLRGFMAHLAERCRKAGIVVKGLPPPSAK